MQKRIILLRHGKTAGNQRGAYIGCKTDEELLAEEKEAISGKRRLFDSLGQNFLLYSSPLKRAVETAECFFPGKGIRIREKLREIDFGMFEGKNHKMLDGDSDYQAWIDSGGTMQIPGGEGRPEFEQRSVEAFYEILKEAAEKSVDTIVIICHGGNIMSVMRRLTGGDYYDYQVGNLDGFEIELEYRDGEISLLTYNRIFAGNIG